MMRSWIVWMGGGLAPACAGGAQDGERVRGGKGGSGAVEGSGGRDAGGARRGAWNWAGESGVDPGLGVRLARLRGVHGAEQGAVSHVRGDAAGLWREQGAA